VTGAFDFSKMDTEGPYKVGMRRIHITDKQIEASIFYPIDKSTKSNCTLWFPNATKTIQGMKRVFGHMFGIPYFPDFILRPYTKVKIPVIENGDISIRFS
jgi:hypothetical protein